MPINEDDERIIKASGQVKDVRRRRELKIIGVICLLFMTILAAAATSSYLTLLGAAKDGTELAQQVQAECESEAVVDPDLAQFCPQAGQVVEDAPIQVKTVLLEGPAGPKGDQGDPGKDAPAITDTQVLSAVRQYCSMTEECKGDKGRNASAAQVALAVTTYCRSNGDCAGAVGPTGPAGEDADPVTQGQIVAAVDAYCSTNNDCRGPAGEDGQDGQNGSDSNVPGPPGVVKVVDNCEPAPDGKVIADVNPSYNPDTQTVSFDCSYKDDQTGLLTGVRGDE